MDDARKKALRQCHPDLRKGITVSSFLPNLHVHAGGFLTDVESDRIKAKSTGGNVEQVDELIDVLVKKENKDFDYFCDVLEKEGYPSCSNSLKAAAGLGPTTSVGTSSQGLTTEVTPSPASTEARDKETTAATVQQESLAKLRSQLSDKLLRILVVGEPGSGKSTLTQNLLGLQLKGKRGELREYSVSASECPLVLYFSYGIEEDTDKHFRKISQLVRDDSLSLIIYCLPINATRLREGFYGTIKKHSEIGIKWDRCLLALTFTDMLQASGAASRQERRAPSFDPRTFFMRKKEDWVREIKQRLLDNGVLTKSAFSVIRIHSTTEHSTEPLPNGRDWYGPIWADIVDILLH